MKRNVSHRKKLGHHISTDLDEKFKLNKYQKLGGIKFEQSILEDAKKETAGKNYKNFKAKDFTTVKSAHD